MGSLVFPQADGGQAGPKRNPDCKGSSFVAGTEVLMADGTAKNIEDVQVGDMVHGPWNPETGEWAARQVTHLIRSQGDKQLAELSIANGDGIEPLTATDNHPSGPRPTPLHRRADSDRGP
ncbi:Hint domain-containing homing endonuclease [Streptomyces clavuligerus]|uniref:Hint domain-containing homing endonuclease n=1 Tax=Streptomyces clavuligerus TaxID=1901 RepID=UPI0013C4B794|nr:Hint domain-containing homing endonuclease [Streptomyces clavuligerus]